MPELKSQADLIKCLKADVKRIVKPEPQHNLFYKYLAQDRDVNADTKEAITHLTNSHGLQLRNDVKYWIDKRHEEQSKDAAVKEGPVLDESDLNIFENYDEIIEKLKCLPQEWTVLQITKKFTDLDVLTEVKKNKGLNIYITRFSCGKLVEKIKPYYVTVETGMESEEDFLSILDNLLRVRREYFSSGGLSRKLRDEYLTSDSVLEKLVNEIQNYCLKEWRCLFTGRIQDKNLEIETLKQVKTALDNYHSKGGKKRVSQEALDLAYQVTLSAHLMKNSEITSVLKRAIGVRATEKSNDLVLLMEELKRINLANSCEVKRAKRNPVILIIDNDLELLPWEMISPLSGQPVSRIISLHLLYAVFKHHEPNIVNGYRIIKIDSGYCFINPDKDLDACEKEMTQFIKAHIPWVEYEAGRAPDPEALFAKLEKFNVFFYCGHGSGGQYLKRGELRKAVVRGLVLLFGCSSNRPKSAGGRTPFQNTTYTYLTNGCPCLVGCLYDITSSDADIGCKEMLSNILPIVGKQDSGITYKSPRESNVLLAVAEGKTLCRKYWSQCSFVVRGIPCKTVKGNLKEARQSQ